ncbi:MAG: hypothetical protein ACWA6V_17790, partial [Cellvibrio sp.]
HWVPLVLFRASSRYTAKLPVLAGAAKASLRISLGDTQKGVKLTQTLEEIIELGQGAQGVGAFPPAFAPLPRLTVEASAALTDYSLPPVFAQDAKDGQIAAITASAGPYSIGTHLIRWSATNSAGKTATGLQTLDVRDTTAPAIQTPANITVDATGVFTDVPQPEVKAYDLVDGEITAWTMDWKPFPVGTSYVIWNASDSRYNLSYITQTITVKAAAASSQAQSSSSKAAVNSGGGSGSGGGGGLMGIWMLLLCGVLAGAPTRQRYRRSGDKI